MKCLSIFYNSIVNYEIRNTKHECHCATTLHVGVIDWRMVHAFLRVTLRLILARDVLDGPGHAGGELERAGAFYDTIRK